MKSDTPTLSRTAARILVDQLVIQGVDTAFCVPGESFLAVLDALADTPQIRLITCRHEGAATMMAEAYGKLTGRPGVAFVSRGPGSTNGSSGLHVAKQDSTPFLMFIGQNPQNVMEREGFQEIDYRRMFGQLSKAVIQIEDPARMSEFITRSFALAVSGRPGPVVIALPEDMLTEEVEGPDGAFAEPPETGPTPSALAHVRDALQAAEKPLVLLGGSDWAAEDVAALRNWAEASGLPVCATFRRQDLLDNESPNYMGELGLGANPKLVAKVKEADVILALGARLGEIGTLGYTMMDIPCPAQKLIHVYPDPDELGHVFRPEIGVVSRPGVFASLLAEAGPLDGSGWTDWVAEGRAAFEAWTAPRKSPGAIQMCEIMAWIDANVPEDTIYTNGAGNFSVWLHRFHRYRAYGTQVAPVAGAMGYGFPAALASKLARPEATVICVAGDGDFQMTLTELATAVENNIKVRVLILNNGMLGTIRMHQEREYPGRVSATSIGNPDFAALAMAYGAYGEKVETTEAFAEAFKRADAFDGPAVLEVMIDPEAISPAFSLSELRESALKKKG
ncbi:thiamine pyrophosphate-binding protein [Pseudooceanicola sp. HF7]|uniref:thiamine pyrophosphate-binding protein n=1 Tax=Pseudooceanicola sp. HF7 TaxID=2721560 RepID=UPI001430884B|nr:thiamine pyrophosphate-binding protein [Pseudooceanicola sp. HF7]NIZ09910.1 thiamine pyrophosphate-binding protein [Pseudooceanicola sp. HF7]